MMFGGRVTDRLRPWAAPRPPDDSPTIAVIGAGPAGLATAALLRRVGMDTTIFDRSDQIGGAWPHRYDSLRLNTVRWMSDLPGLRMDRSLGRWVGRDDLVTYLRRYADHHGLDVRLGPPADVERVARSAKGGWSIELPNGSRAFDGVVIATGHSLRPVMPEWAGLDRFEGRVMHSAEYRRPADHLGARVLVVGAGSSGGEICVDLANAGVDVTWSVRTAPRVFPREVFGVPATPFAPPSDLLPDPLLDRLAPQAERLVYGRRDYLPEPVTPMMQLLARCKEPMTADGIVELIREGRVEVVAAVAALERTGAVLTDGTRVPAEHVIAATGYRTGLDPLVGDLGVLDPDGRPTSAVPVPGLGFVGFRVPLTGTLWAIDRDARHVASSIAATARGRVRPQGLEP